MQKIYLIFFLCLVFYGCKKNPLDYRTKFLGEYNFEIYQTSWWHSGPRPDTNYISEGKIEIASEDRIEIFLSKNLSSGIKVSVYEDGSIADCECDYHAGLNGEFESTNKIKFIYGYHGLGSGFTSNVKGNKK